uniref:mRNA decay activator protein ZFP36 n=1 Tax=Poecilia formosa TaxID=48698 RepID=A0A096MC34_POEFO
VAPPPGFPPSSNLPAQVPPMLSSNRYKTELCRGYQESGTCKYGSKCQFAHGEAELRGMFRHPKYKTEPCRTFYNFGYCPYGSRCHFIHEQQNPSASGSHNPRHQLRQSVSFAGFMGPSRSSSPPSFSSLFNDPNLGFTRAPSVSPPPADLLSPVHQTRTSTGNIPLILEPKPTRCVCNHGNNFSSIGSTGGFTRSAGLQRFSSEDSLEDSYSSSSSSGSESPIFDGSATKRLTVFERLSLSD